MAGYGLATFPSRAGPAKRSLLINGNICEVVSLRCEREIAQYVEDSGLLIDGEDLMDAFQPSSPGRWREQSVSPAGNDASLASNRSQRNRPEDKSRSAASSAHKAPVRLIPPSGDLDTWAIAVGPPTRPAELLVIQSSTPFLKAMDELCEMMAKWSLRDDPLPPSAHVPNPLASLDDIAAAFTSLSLADFSPPTPPPVESDLDLWDEEPLFCGYTSFCDTDAESVCDSISDATCVEEESMVSWTTVCDEPEGKGDMSDDGKDILLKDILGGLQDLATTKSELAVASSSTFPTPVTSRPTTSCTLILVGLQLWQPSSPASLNSLFAPSLRCRVLCA